MSDPTSGTTTGSTTTFAIGSTGNTPTNDHHHHHHDDDVTSTAENSSSSSSSLHREHQQQNATTTPTEEPTLQQRPSTPTVTATTAIATPDDTIVPPRIPTTAIAATTTSSSSSSSPPPWTSATTWQVSRYYCWMSTIGALLAIIVVASSSPSAAPTNTSIPNTGSTTGTSNTTLSLQITTPTNISVTTATTTSTVPTNLSTGTCGSSSTSTSTSTGSILSNALSSFTSTTTTASSSSDIKSINDDDHDVCLSSSSATDIASDDDTNAISKLSIATTEDGSSSSSSETNIDDNDDANMDSHWWFRWLSLPQQPKIATTANRNHNQGRTLQVSNDAQQQQPLLQLQQQQQRQLVPDNETKNFFQSWVDAILMKHTTNDKDDTTKSMESGSGSKGDQQIHVTTANATSKNQKMKNDHQQRPSTNTTTVTIPSSFVSSLLQVLLFSWLDPNLIAVSVPVVNNTGSNTTTSSSTFPFDTVITNLIDKILTSTIRLLLITNWLMALTFLLYMAVADYFLGYTAGSSRSRNNNMNGATPGRHNRNTTTTTTTTTTTPAAGTISASRERMGGYLFLKFLLICAMVGPDTFDFLILVSWYTVLTFLRSLATLCIQQIDNCRLLLRNVPQIGVLQLLCTVLCLDGMAAMTCIGLFHGAGYGMVILLTCDCVVLAFDTISHIIQYYQSIIDVQHAKQIQEIDDEQMTLHYQLLQQQQHENEQQPSVLIVEVASAAVLPVDDTSANLSIGGGLNGDDESDDNHFTIEERCKELDQQMELLEQRHNHTTSMIETVIFVLQLMIDILTILHFLHIWTLHGMHVTFIDGVIALHLHSSATSALKKIHDRQATYRITRDMDAMFHNATENDLQNAYKAGDVCCICLGTMHYFPTNKSVTNTSISTNRKDHTKCNHPQPSNVKKVACGHLYHTACLREVIERARSIESARCPLCRAPFVPPKEQRNTTAVVDPPRGDPSIESTNNETRRQDDTTTADHGNVPTGGAVATPVIAGPEDSIFRFTTEGMLPDWIPLPGFSFEIVRRPPPSPTTTAAAAPVAGENDANVVVNAPEINEQNPRQQPQQPAAVEQSIFRRIMLLLRIVQMSPEEEAIALEQLIDMFPQYERQDLQRSLRQRGTIDAVVESLLLREMVAGGGAI